MCHRNIQITSGEVVDADEFLGLEEEERTPVEAAQGEVTIIFAVDASSVFVVYKLDFLQLIFYEYSSIINVTLTH